ncbi:hypothetical protein K439DRAFT_1625998 [Ramaria rubella]|nr:hypothetical protein K439DRAFT_1625998 [Ramaria rubella]
MAPLLRNTRPRRTSVFTPHAPQVYALDAANAPFDAITMIPIILTVALALLSFISSAFVIFRIVVPILPPNPLSHRVPPSEFGLPNYRSLSPADKSHIWLACLDILALGFFLWQAIADNLSSSSALTHDPLSAARLWIALTTRQTCLLFIVSLTLLYVRLGRSVSFGPKHCLIWAPTLIFVATGTGVGAVLAGIGMNTLWGGLVAFSTTIAVLTTVSMGCLIGTLLLIRHNINMVAQAELEDKEWPPVKEKVTHQSIATEDIEALKDGSSWITSHRSSASSRQNSISAFSFSTAHHSARGDTIPITGSAPSVLPKSSYWFGTATPNSAALISQDSIPPVPRVPSPYRDRPSTPPPVAPYTDLSDPFHRSPPRQAKSSANSWLTSPSVSQVTLTEFSFPTTRPGTPNEHEQLTRTALTPTVYENRATHSRATTAVQPLAESRVLGGYGLQSGLAGLSPKASRDIDISVGRCLAWTVSIWLPIGLSLPYFFTASPAHVFTSPIIPVLFTLSVTLPSPLLALNLLLRSPLPIPAALFSRSYTSAPTSEAPNSRTEIRIHPEMRARSTSMTVVEDRRSGDVWIANGEAVDGRGKAARVLGLLAPTPRLAVLPPAEDGQANGELTPPLPIQDEYAASMALSSPSANSAEMGVARSRKDSKASSYYSGADDSLAYKSQIMVAQRHYSAMATTVYIPASPKFGSGSYSQTAANPVDQNGSFTTGVERRITRGHARTQSASSSLQTPRSSMQHRFPLTPPPASPLPPTPPNVRALQHSRSQSSSGSGFSFGPIGNANQIDSLSAGVLPLLVPGLKVGRNMISDSSSPPRKQNEKTSGKDDEFGFMTSTSFNSPEMHSTPAKAGKRMGNGNRWKHLSLPSLGLGKDGIHSLSAWKEELVRVLDGFEAKTPSTTRHRRTVHGGEAEVPVVMVQKTSSGTLDAVNEESQVEFGYALTTDDQRRASVRTFGPTPPTSASVYSNGFNTARSSMATMVENLPTSATALLQPTFNEQQNHAHTSSKVATQNKTRSYHLPVRKSSVVYIKSDDEGWTSPPVQTDTQVKSRQWLPRASAKQNIPGTSKTFTTDSEPSPLRKLTLLGHRDMNLNGSGPGSPGTPPLTISKKIRKHSDKENGGSGLRPLKLARSATAKARGLLRQNEVLPNVIVRPPSASNHTGFGYSFS